MVCLAIPFHVFVCQLSLERGLFLSRHSQILLFFLMKMCAIFPPVKVAFQNTAESFANGEQMAREVDEAWTNCQNSTNLDWTRAFAHDGRDPRSWPRTRPCRGQHVLEQCYTANQHGAWISCARCALRLHYVLRHTVRMTSVSTPSSASVQEALKRMSLQRDTDFTAKAVTDMTAQVEGRKPRKKKAPPQPTIVHNTVYHSGAAIGATISSGTPVHTEISTPPSPRVSPITRRWRLLVVSILQTERIGV